MTTTGRLRPPKRIEPLIRIPNKRQTRRILILISRLRSLRPMRSRCILLVNLINREILRINVTLQLRFKRRADTAETVPSNTSKKGVLFDLVGAADAAKAVFGVTYQTIISNVSIRGFSPPRLGLGNNKAPSEKKKRHTGEQSPQPQHQVAGQEGNASSSANQQSCGKYHAAPQRRTAASQSNTQT